MRRMILLALLINMLLCAPFSSFANDIDVSGYTDKEIHIYGNLDIDSDGSVDGYLNTDRGKTIHVYGDLESGGEVYIYNDSWGGGGYYLNVD